MEAIENHLIDKVMTTTAANDQSFLNVSFCVRFRFFYSKPQSLFWKDFFFNFLVQAQNFTEISLQGFHVVFVVRPVGVFANMADA